MPITTEHVRKLLAIGFAPRLYKLSTRRESGYFLVTKGQRWTDWSMQRVPMRIAKRKWFQKLVRP